MAKYQITKGATSQIFQIFIADSSSTTGAGKTGLAFNTSSLTAYYHRDTDTTATAISLVTMTVGTFTSSGFKEIDATNMPGWYQLCPPNAALASGAANVGFHLQGAAGMAPLPIEVQLSALDIQDGVRGALTALPNAAAGANGGLPLGDASGRVDVGKALGTAVTLDANSVLNVSSKYLAGTALTGRDIGASVLLSPGTGTGQLDFTSGVVKANLVQILATALTETAGQIAGAFKKLFDVAAPTLTCLDINQTGDSYARIGAAGVGLTNLGDTRIANLDAAVSTRLAPAGTLAAVTLVATTTNVTNDVGITQAAADKVFGGSGAALAELTGVPSATPTPRNALMLIFMALRNKLTTTSSAKTIFNDAGSSIASKALSDDGTTYTEAKLS